MIIIIESDGTVTAVAHDTELTTLNEALGPIESCKRGGHVVPAARVKRMLFTLFRKTKIARAANWTRSWAGPWIVDLTVSDGPILGPFAKRVEAIAAEETWLSDRILET